MTSEAMDHQRDEVRVHLEAAEKAAAQMNDARSTLADCDEWKTFDVGTVVACEDADFRYHLMPDKGLNANGLATLHLGLKTLQWSQTVPGWLVLPAGLLFGDLPESDVEGTAAAQVERLLHTQPRIGSIFGELTKRGLRGLVLGFDSTSSKHQVPMVVSFKDGDAVAVALARRSDTLTKDQMPPRGLLRVVDDGTTTEGSKIYVGYCGELQFQRTYKDGVVRGVGRGARVQLGIPKMKLKCVLDPAHLFRKQGWPARKKMKALTGIGYFVTRTLGNASGQDRLAAPVFSSAFLAGRAPAASMMDLQRYRPTLSLAADKGNRAGNKLGSEVCIVPEEVLVARDPGSDDVRLTINLFNTKTPEQ